MIVTFNQKANQNDQQNLVIFRKMVKYKKMKKALWFFGALILVVGLYLGLRPKPETKVLGTESQQVATPAPAYANLISFDFNSQTLGAAWYKVTDPFNLFLIANFDQKDNAKDVSDAKACKALTNAGFYTTDNQPTGLFISEGVITGKFIPSQLADGILSVNYLGTPRITRVVPTDTLRVAVQAGPLLKENNAFQKLNLIEDKQARRVVAGVTGSNELYFIVFYSKNSVYNGPLLVDLPGVVQSFEQKSGIVFADAVNLDGGSASAFYADGFSLSELSPVGAFFCAK